MFWKHWDARVPGEMHKIVTMRTLFIVLILSLSTPTFAARPFVTDDARLTTGGSCQLESWTRIYKGSNQFWAFPACNPTGNFEITAGVGNTKPTGEAAVNDYVLQGKTLFRNLTTNDYGVGLAVGQIRHPSTTLGPNGLGNTYAFVPLSISTNNDKLIVHTNLGWLKDKQTNQQQMTYGVGSELQTSNRMIVIAEIFGDNKTKPYWQTGARYSLIPNLLQLDATIGQQFDHGTSTRWISFGLRYIPDSLF